MKKISLVLAAFLLLTAFNACGDDTTQPSDETHGTSSQGTFNDQKDTVLPDDIASICKEHGSDYSACVKAANGHTYGVVCEDDWGDERIQDCDAQNLPCGDVVGILNDFKFCKCAKDSECKTSVSNAKGYCIPNAYYCDFECVNGYKMKFDSNTSSYSCIKIK